MIVFRASGVFRLFGIPAVEITNHDHAAHAVIGTAISTLREQLGNARSFPERVRIADHFIARQSVKAQSACSIELAASEIFRNRGACRIDSLVDDTGFSVRSFQRMFQQRIGVSPKLFARIVRFESALKTKAATPHLSWLRVAHQFGYHDHMHLVHDFRQLSGEVPTSLLAQTEAIFAPQFDGASQRDTNLLAL